VPTNLGAGVPHFGREEVLAVGPTRTADAMAACLAMVARGAVVAPVRGHVDFGNGSGTYLISGALLELDILSVKVINVRPANPGRGLERLQGSISVFESSTGRLLATLDARSATQARTAACSIVSLRFMARRDAAIVTIFGTGPQAVAHARALTAERDFKELRIVGRTAESARTVASQFQRAIPATADAVRDSDVVVTATNSTTPLFSSDAVRPGTHLALVGSGNAGSQEVEPRLLGRASSIFVDHRPTCLEESGEIVAALHDGLIREDSIHELGRPS